MRKISRETVLELRKQGIKVVGDDGKPVRPKRQVVVADTEPVALPEVKPVPPPQKEDHTQEIIAVLAETARESAGNAAAIVDVLKQLAAPQVKRKFRCVVGRNSGGMISTMDITEQ